MWPWRNRAVPEPPINVVQGVKLPQPDDERWELADQEASTVNSEEKFKLKVLQIGRVMVDLNSPTRVWCGAGLPWLTEDSERYGTEVVRVYRQRIAGESMLNGNREEEES